MSGHQSRASPGATGNAVIAVPHPAGLSIDGASDTSPPLACLLAGRCERMKLTFRDISAKDGAGKVKIMPEEPEDMWHIYNLVMSGDMVRTTTFRKVVKQSATGSTSSNKVRLNLTIEVERVQFDPDTCVLRLSGKNREETEHVKLGAYHTLDIELNRSFELLKNCWDAVVIDRLEQACDPAQHAEVAAVVLQPGLANVCLVTSCMTIVRQRVEMAIPKKRAGSTQHEKAMVRFHRTIYEAILRHLKFDKVGVVLLAGPGHCHEDFFEFMKEEATKKDDKVLLNNKQKFVLCHASSGYKHALEEVLAQPGIQSRLLDTKAVAEVQAMNEFLEMLSTQVGRAHYGFNHVKTAAENDAIETLLMSDSVFRIKDFKQRRKYVDLVEQVQGKGGRFFCLSSLHVTGEQLHQLGGVAAILRFPLEIDAEEEEEPIDLDAGGIGHVDSDEEEGGGGGAGNDATDMGF